MMTRSFGRWIVCSVLCVLLPFRSWVDRAMNRVLDSQAGAPSLVTRLSRR
jgi:hypothetical protein